MTSKAISTLVFGGVVVALFGISMAFCRGAAPDYLDRYAELAPEDASFVAAVAPPQQLIERFAFDVTDDERAQLAIALGADLLDPQTWRRFGINPIEPVGVIGWGSDSHRTLVFGAHGRSERGRDQLAAWLGGARELTVQRAEFDSMPALTVEDEFVIVYHRRRVLVAFGEQSLAEAHIADVLGDSERFSVHAGRRSATDFSGRPLVSAVARPAGFAETPAQVVTFNRSPAHEFGLTGLALVVRPDGLALETRSVAGAESEVLAALRGGLRTNRGLSFAPGPARVALGGALSPAAFYDLAEQAAQLRVLTAQKFATNADVFATLTGTSVDDALEMLTGEFGLVVSSMPLFGEELEAVAFLGLRDPMAVIAMGSANNDANAAGERREIGGVTIFSTGIPSAPAACVRDGFAWIATSEEFLASVIRGETERIRTASPNAYELLRDASAGSLFLDLTSDSPNGPLDFLRPAQSLAVETSVTRDTLLITALLAGSTDEWRQFAITQMLALHGIERVAETLPIGHETGAASSDEAGYN